MKTLLRIFGCLIIAGLCQSNIFAQDPKIRINENYKPPPFVQYVIKLPPVDRVEIIQLEIIRPGLPNNPTPDNTHCGWEATVKTQKTLTGEAAESIAEMWRNLGENWMGTGCYDPAFIFKFYQKDKILVESCVCFNCSKLTLPDGKLHNFNPQSDGAEKLLEFVKGMIKQSQESQSGPKD